jgi:microcystin-dependent protein
MDYPKSDPTARLHNGKFTDGDPINGILASRDSADYQNMVFDELINVISQAGLQPDEGSVTQVAAAIAAMITSAHIGSVAAFATSSAPTGWLKCNGAELDRTVYADLFAVIGTTFGAGDGSTTFNLPDLRGEFVRGFDDGRGIDGGRVFGSSQSDEYKQHDHQPLALYGGLPSGGMEATSSRFAMTYYNISSSLIEISSTGSWSGYSAGAAVTLEGGNETRPRNVALLFCIKY